MAFDIGICGGEYFKLRYSAKGIARVDILPAPERGGRSTPLTEEAFHQLEEYFKGKRYRFDLPFDMLATDFQREVFRELMKIPYGETRSYKEIATAIGRPKAQRAVGMANHHNPLLILIPCHRVIGARGELCGYRAGLEVKKRLLRLEEFYEKEGGKDLGGALVSERQSDIIK